MAVSPGFANFVTEQLDGCGPIVTRRMFGGVGIYSGDVFFAIIDNDILYLKTDDSNRADFEAAGSGPFRPSIVRGASPRRPPLHARSRGPRAPLRSRGSLADARSPEAGETMMYYSVPVSVLEDADELVAWGRKAIAVAVAATGRKKPRKRTAKN